MLKRKVLRGPSLFQKLSRKQYLLLFELVLSQLSSFTAGFGFFIRIN
jgi:hypothetical protein